jgi:hypothetical protein
MVHDYTQCIPSVTPLTIIRKLFSSKVRFVVSAQVLQPNALSLYSVFSNALTIRQGIKEYRFDLLLIWML